MSIDTLPDCRPSYVLTPRGMVQGPGGMYEPVFCANCPKSAGYVPVGYMRHFFYLCDDCVEKWGAPAGVMLLPDEVFWQAVVEEQMDAFGGLLDAIGLAKVLQEDDSPLATLIKSGLQGK